MLPALPKDAPSPTGPESTRVTVKPALCSHAADETPTMPAPTIVTCPGLTRPSFHLDVAFFDDLAPLVHLAPDELPDLGRRLHRVRFEAQVDHLLAQFIVGGDNFADGGIELRHDIRWRARGRL